MAIDGSGDSSQTVPNIKKSIGSAMHRMQKLQFFQMNVINKPGKEISEADTLSRAFLSIIAFD